MIYDSVYYDSYGVGPTKAVQPFARKYNDSSYQALDSEACGYFAVYVAKNLLAGRAPYLNMIEGDYKHNEDLLKKYFL